MDIAYFLNTPLDRIKSLAALELFNKSADDLSENIIEQLCFRLRFCINLETLDLSSFDFANLQDEHIKIFFSALKDGKKIKSINLSCNNFSRFSTYVLNHVTTFLVNCRFLNTLNLAAINLQDMSKATRTKLFRSIAKCQTITNLELNCNSFSLLTDQEFLLLCNLINKLNNLKSISLMSIGLGDFSNNKICFLATAIRNHKSLIELKLDNNDFSKLNIPAFSMLFDSLQGTVNLTSLSVRKILIERFDSVQMQLFVNFLRNKKLSNLNLASNNFSLLTTEALQCIFLTLAASKTLTTLNIFSTNLESLPKNQLIFICNCLRQIDNLTELKISYLCFPAETQRQHTHATKSVTLAKVTIFCRAFINKNLRVADFSSNNIGLLDSCGWDCFLNTVKTWQHLIQLNLSNNHLHLMPTKLLVNLFSTLENLNNLQYLDICSNQMGIFFATHIFAMQKLMQNSNIIGLNISKTRLENLQPKQFIQFARVLATSRSIQLLNLSGNNFNILPEQLVFDFFLELAKIPTLQQVTLASCNLTTQQLLQINKIFHTPDLIKVLEAKTLLLCWHRLRYKTNCENNKSNLGDLPKHVMVHLLQTTGYLEPNYSNSTGRKSWHWVSKNIKVYI